MTIVERADHIQMQELNFLNELDYLLPDSREKSIAKTKIEEATLWALKCLNEHGKELTKQAFIVQRGCEE